MTSRTFSGTTGTLSYTSSAQLSSLNFQTSSGGALAAEQFGYDANLRTTSEMATWGGPTAARTALSSAKGSAMTRPAM